MLSKKIFNIYFKKYNLVFNILIMFNCFGFCQNSNFTSSSSKSLYYKGLILKHRGYCANSNQNFNEFINTYYGIGRGELVKRGQQQITNCNNDSILTSYTFKKDKYLNSSLPIISKRNYTSTNLNADLVNVSKEEEKCCTFTDLSYTYIYKITTTELTNDSTESVTKRIDLIIYNKTSNFPVDSLRILSDELLLEVLKDSNSVRSYITNKNTSAEILDNHYGDVVIEDFNFDSLEDIAVINESGSYSGPRYLFFIQSKNGKFIIDTFLSTIV